MFHHSRWSGGRERMTLSGRGAKTKLRDRKGLNASHPGTCMHVGCNTLSHAVPSYMLLAVPVPSLVKLRNA